MKLYIRERVFSWGDKFTVKDESGCDKYRVEGEVFTFGKKLHVYDMHGREVAYIAEKLFTWMPRYQVWVDGREIAEIRREFTFFRPKYRIDGLGWEINGSFWEHNYEIMQNERPIVSLQKEWMTWGDSYELDIRNPADEILALAVVITIDCVAEQQANNS